MRAWVLHGVGDLRLEEREKPSPGPGEARIAVAYAGICGSDVPRICQTGAHRHPLVPGHEFAGYVDALGDINNFNINNNLNNININNNLNNININIASLLSKPVGVFPLIPCRRCPSCQAGHFELCRAYNYIGSRCDGAFADYVIAPVRNLLPLPAEMPLDLAAMLEPMAVAIHAIRRLPDPPANLSAIAVCGLGPVGFFVALFLRALGCPNLYVLGKHTSQRLLAQELQFTQYIDIQSEDPVAALRAQCPDGLDAYFECVGRAEPIAYGLQTLRPLGHMVVVGNPAGDMELPRDAWWQILRQQLTLTGTWNSSFTGQFHNNINNLNNNNNLNHDDWHEVLRLIAADPILAVQLRSVISHRLPLEGLDEGLRLMQDPTVPTCKVMLEINTPIS